MLLEALYPCKPRALQPALAAFKICQTAANWTGAVNNQHNPVYQKELPSALLFCGCPRIWEALDKFIEDIGPSLPQRRQWWQHSSVCLSLGHRHARPLQSKGSKIELKILPPPTAFLSQINQKLP